MPSNRLILCCPFLLPPSIFPSIRVFSNESVLSIRWPKYWSFSFSISPSNEYSELISFRIDWFTSLVSNGLSRVFFSSTTIQKHQFFWHSVFFMVQFSHPYMTTGKTIALTIWTFISNVMSLRFNMLSSFVLFCFFFFCHSFSSKEQVSLNFVAAVTICSDFGVQENKVCDCFHCFPIHLP